jgi:predicted lysophospholipase L1 biosynthesis ABC-type transport system permease subunit
LWPDEVEPGWRPLELSTVSESPRSIADRPEILTALAVVGLVMLLACGNVANILLGIGAMRRQEVGIRLALGASRSRLVRQWITESLALAIIGGGAGLALAFWLVPLLARTALVAPQAGFSPDCRPCDMPRRTIFMEHSRAATGVCWRISRSRAPVARVSWRSRPGSP